MTAPNTLAWLNEKAREHGAIVRHLGTRNLHAYTLHFGYNHYLDVVIERVHDGLAVTEYHSGVRQQTTKYGPDEFERAARQLALCTNNFQRFDPHRDNELIIDICADGYSYTRLGYTNSDFFVPTSEHALILKIEIKPPVREGGYRSVTLTMAPDAVSHPGGRTIDLGPFPVNHIRGVIGATETYFEFLRTARKD